MFIFSDPRFFLGEGAESKLLSHMGGRSF